MKDYLNLIIQSLLILILIVITFLLLRLRKSLIKEKRVTKFAIDPLKKRNLSFFDKIDILYKKVITKLSKFLSKLKIFDKYSQKYEKYVDQTKIEKTVLMDFISNKIMIGLFAVTVTIISDVLRLRELDILQLVVAFIIGFFLEDIFLEIEYKQKMHIIEEDLFKSITIMSNAFKSGRSIMQAVELVSKELTGPIADEFKKMYIDLTYGLDLEVVFNRFSKRIDLEDAKYMTSSLVILNKTGGNIVKIFNSIEKGFYERKKLHDELKSATSLSEIVFKVLIAIPVVVFFMIYLLNPSYFSPLTTTILGKIILVLILLIYLCYIVIVRKITKGGDSNE